MGSVHEEIYAQVKRLVEGDSGNALGLSKTSLDYYVRPGDVIRDGEKRETLGLPRIVASVSDVVEHDSNPPGPVAVTRVRLALTVDRDSKEFTDLNLLASRLRDVFDGSAAYYPTTAGENYRISSFMLDREAPARITDKELEYGFDFTVVATPAEVGSSSTVSFLLTDVSTDSLDWIKGGYARNLRYIVVGLGDAGSPGALLEAGLGAQGDVDLATGSIIHRVTRNRLLNKNDAEFTVEIAPGTGVLPVMFEAASTGSEIDKQTVPWWNIAHTESDSVEFPYWAWAPFEIDRVRFYRTYTRENLGISEANIQTINSLYAGRFADFSDGPYLFLGCRAWQQRSGLFRVVTKFYRYNAVPEREGDSAFVLPALSELQVYRIGDASADPPTVIPYDLGHGESGFSLVPLEALDLIP